MIVQEGDYVTAETEDDANDYEETVLLLSNDRKFMGAINELQKDFSAGYKRLNRATP